MRVIDLPVCVDAFADRQKVRRSRAIPGGVKSLHECEGAPFADLHGSMLDLERLVPRVRGLPGVQADARHEARNTSTLGYSAGNCSRRWQA